MARTDCRRELARALGRRKVSDPMWAYLVNEGYIAELEGGHGDLGNVVTAVRRIEAAAKPDRTSRAIVRPPVDQAEQARVDAIGALHVRAARRDPAVNMYRLARLEGAPLTVTAARRWIDGEAARCPVPPKTAMPYVRPDGTVTWDERHRARDVRRLQVALGPDTVDEVVAAEAPEGGPTPLAQLAELAAELAETWSWSAPDAAGFVLTDTPPAHRTATAEVRWNMSTPTAMRIVLSVDPAATERQVMDWYGEVRRQIAPPQRVRQMSEKHCRLAAFVGNRPALAPEGPDSWESRRRAWGERFPKWAYESVSNFARDARTASERLGNPGWVWRA